MILSVKPLSPIWPNGGSEDLLPSMEKVRKLIETRAKELGLHLNGLSEEMGLNVTYLQQFVRYGKPKKGLPEKVRHDLALRLQLDEAQLGAPSSSLRVATPADDTSLFKIEEKDVRGSAGYSGIGVDSTTMQLDASGWRFGENPRTTQTFYFPEDYARKELGLHPGKADILPIQGDSMDDGSKHSLVDGDRVIIDLSSRDLRQGAIFAVWDGEGVIIKQIEVIRGSVPPELLCTSLNARYKPFRLLLTDNVHVIGRVVAKLARM